jgi:hypothetical protein
MREITLVYKDFPVDTVLDGVVTRQTSIDDEENICDGGDWQFLFFDVLLYRGTQLHPVLRRCVGAVILQTLRPQEDDCFDVCLQRSYPVSDLDAIFVHEARDYAVEGAVFTHSLRQLCFKWNAKEKRRVVLQIRPTHLVADTHVAFDLVTSDDRVVQQCILKAKHFIAMLLVARPRPRVECQWGDDEWKIAKPNVDSARAHSMLQLHELKRVVQRPIDIVEIKQRFTKMFR